jgi:hypothetical protein
MLNDGASVCVAALEAGSVVDVLLLPLPLLRVCNTCCLQAWEASEGWDVHLVWMIGDHCAGRMWDEGLSHARGFVSTVCRMLLSLSVTCVC